MSRRVRALVLGCTLLVGLATSGPVRAAHVAGVCAGNLPWSDSSGLHYTKECHFIPRGVPVEVSGGKINSTSAFSWIHVWIDWDPSCVTGPCLDQDAIVSPPLLECRYPGGTDQIGRSTACPQRYGDIGSQQSVSNDTFPLTCHAEVPVGKTGHYSCIAGTGA